MTTLVVFGAKYLYLIIVALFGYFFIIQKKEIRRKIIKLSIISLPAIYVFAKLLGLVFYNPRPFVIDKFVPLIHHIADNGFPSDHTLLSAALSFVVCAFNKKMGIFLLFLSLLIGFARVSVGVHHFIDIFGSIIIAGTTIAIIEKVLTKNKGFLDFFRIK